MRDRDASVRLVALESGEGLGSEGGGWVDAVAVVLGARLPVGQCGPPSLNHLRARLGLGGGGGYNFETCV